MSLPNRPIALIILDGFGIAPSNQANAVTLAQKPFFDSLLQNYPTLLLQASGLNVGLPQTEVGNSEVGHVNIGSGLLKYQSLPRIDKSISTGQFFKLKPLQEAVEMVKKNKSKLHLVGMIGNGGVHSSQEHLEALITFAKLSKLKKQTYLHVFLDGRDTAKDLGKEFMEKTLEYCKKEKTGQIASICGRALAMDRNKNWEKTQKAYNAIFLGQAEKTHRGPVKAIEESYAAQVYDEQMEPVVITDRKGNPTATVEEGDVVMYFNFRADRARQLTQAAVEPEFNKFPRKELQNFKMITFTEYKKGLPVDVLFPVEVIKNPIAKVFSDYNLKQLHIAETEKYAHVTFFLNGMQEDSFPGEERVLIPSPSVSTYDEKPEMSAYEVTNNILRCLRTDAFDFFVVNFANPDMVGHTGNLQATVKAVEAVDSCLAKIIPEIVKKNGIAFVVADHGNAEELINPITGAVDKEHNNYPVPFIIVGNQFAGQPNEQLAGTDLSLITPVGILSDVTPTILSLAGIPLPPEMTGTRLI
ncbi:MAG: 2,3-bisphosphoglycerate-independent phosphoglycerate mutase [Candidatus Magasanikbacteria bacterium]|nr:2,3-bisphosphoglycerate-independent phosphoglycerate mutase [Candidatus Magasanikbacteria bacterium]